MHPLNGGLLSSVNLVPHQAEGDLGLLLPPHCLHELLSHLGSKQSMCTAWSDHSALVRSTRPAAARQQTSQPGPSSTTASQQVPSELPSVPPICNHLCIVYHRLFLRVASSDEACDARTWKECSISQEARRPTLPSSMRACLEPRPQRMQALRPAVPCCRAAHCQGLGAHHAHLDPVQQAQGPPVHPRWRPHGSWPCRCAARPSS